MVIQRVLCPVDFSWHSRRAVHHARAIATAYHAELHVVHVLTELVPPVAPLAGPLAPGVLPDLRPGMQATLEAFISESGSADGVRAVVRHGAPVAEILGYAEEIHADLLVVGTRGHSLFDQVLLGSTAERLVHLSTCPVLTVPRGADEVGFADRLRFTHVLCAIDFSPASTHALEIGLSVAESSAVRCTFLHVVETLPVDEVRALAHLSVGEFEAGRTQDALDRLEGLVSPELRKSGQVAVVVVAGRTARAILSEADARQVDLIVMGSQERGTLGQMLFGSTTHAVLHHATCSVLTACGACGDALRKPA